MIIPLLSDHILSCSMQPCVCLCSNNRPCAPQGPKTHSEIGFCFCQVPSPYIWENSCTHMQSSVTLYGSPGSLMPIVVGLVRRSPSSIYQDPISRCHCWSCRIFSSFVGLHWTWCGKFMMLPWQSSTCAHRNACSSSCMTNCLFELVTIACCIPWLFKSARDACHGAMLCCRGDKASCLEIAFGCRILALIHMHLQK